jgi:hypothetical protein
LRMEMANANFGLGKECVVVACGALFRVSCAFLVRWLDPSFLGISFLRFGVIEMAVFISAFPLFIWTRLPSIRWLGRVSFTRWSLLGVGFGVVAMMCAIAAAIIAGYLTPS